MGLETCLLRMDREKQLTDGHPIVLLPSGYYPTWATYQNEKGNFCASQVDLRIDVLSSRTDSLFCIPSQPVSGLPLSEYEKRVRDHALLAVIAFMILLPIDVLMSRYWRTFSNW
jgi:hypothetical protein